MDWSSIIVALIAALVPTGGLTAIVTLKDKKTAAFLDNTEKLINQWQEIADGRKVRMDELKSDLDRKEDLIQEQWKEISGLRNELDHARTDKAVAELMRCEKTSCPDRMPPFGQGAHVKCEIENKRLKWGQ